MHGQVFSIRIVPGVGGGGERESRREGESRVRAGARTTRTAGPRARGGRGKSAARLGIDSASAAHLTRGDDEQVGHVHAGEHRLGLRLVPLGTLVHAVLHTPHGRGHGDEHRRRSARDGAWRK